MTTLSDLVPDANTILSLEPEELAGLAMELIKWPGENTPSRLHPSSFTSPETLGAFQPPLREQIAFAMAEGWHSERSRPGAAEPLLAPRE